ncbi:MAG: efflux RND transporter periplasmic adaptor subunit [Acidobacteria bacterium]|nr:efflux RND transporter periplasmic adaptor subunit [Acidobacteriota bacterium]
MSLRAKVYGTLTLLVLATGGGYLYKVRPAWLTAIAQAKESSSDQGKKEKEAIPVEVAAAKRSEIAAYLSSTANLRALRDVAVSIQTEGIVQKVLVEEGDFVKEGQVLCTLDDKHLQLRLDLAVEKRAQASLQMEKARTRQEKAVAQIGHAKAELSRYEKAAREGLVSDKEVATYRYRLEELDHDQKVAAYETKELQHRTSELETEIAQTKLEIARSQVKAPYDGFVTQRSVNLGQRVRAMDALFNVGAFSPLYADVHLSEKDAGSVRPNQMATIHLGSDETTSVQGKVERISPVVDGASGTIKVTIALSPLKGFRPGAFVRVGIQTDKKADATLIPKRAVVEEDGVNYVYVTGKDSAARTKVKLGYQSEGMVEVLSGVSPGQSVVVAGQGALKEGSKIRILPSNNAQGKPAASLPLRRTAG